MALLKQKRAPGPRWHTDRADYFASISQREYLSLARFSLRAEAIGLKTTGIGKGPFGAGCLLKMSRGYEALVDGTGNVILGRVEADGKRVRLWETGTTQAGWDMLLRVLESSEGRQP
jgi:hypothetical protein